MGKFYGCTRNTITKHAKEIGFDISSVQQYKLTEEDKQRIRSLYYEKQSNELAEEYNVPRGMITRIWYDAGLKNKKRECNPKYDLTNMRFSRLMALYPTKERDIQGNIKWMCLCDCGTYKEISAYALLSEKIKSCGCLCKECQGNIVPAQAEDLTGQTFGKLTVIKRCDNKNGLVRWVCQCQCGRYTEVYANNLKRGNSQTCGFCLEKSHGNIKIEKILSNANIEFEREQRFDTCRDINELPFDFYVMKAYLIEYDGIQHFEDVGGYFDLELIKKHDKIKNEWCKENNIPLIRIPYTIYDELCLEDLLLETSKYII